MNNQLVRSFIDQINQHNSDGLAQLMTDDHEFIDAYGNKVTGKEQMKAGWETYFQWFPDYAIETEKIFEDGDLLMAYGFASGTFKNLQSENNQNYWRIPAAWKIVVADQKIKVWQVYVDTKVPFDIITRNSTTASAEKRVTGIGGIFFKAENPQQLREWYAKHLGFELTEWGGATFSWREVADPSHIARTEWSIFKAATTYFDPGIKPFMFNYRVSNLDELLKTLKAEGVMVMDKTEDSEYGKFGWIMDPEGNKIELWEPKGE